MKNKLTITKAKAQGYKLCGQQTGEWTTLSSIEDVYFEEGVKLFLAEKEPQIFSFGKDEIAALLSDTIGENESEETGRDTDCIYDAILEIDFSHTEKLIKDALKKHPSYKLTDIELIKD